MVEKACCSAKNYDAGVLVIRFALALVFIVHGLSKFQAMDGTIAYFGSLGLDPFFAYFVAGSELFGGLAILFGMYTTWASLLLATVMIGAIVLVKISKGFVGGYEYELTLLLMCLGLALLGNGKYSMCPGCKQK